INALDFTITQIASGFRQPRGLALLNSETLAVSDTLGHAIYTINLLDNEVQLLSGNNGAGFNDGPASVAKFNSPWGLTRSPNGSLLVADRLNHRVRVVGTNGFARTLYGGDKARWLRPFAGWRDGDETTAQAREPIGVAVSDEGTLYVTEKYWNIVREVTGANLNGSSTNFNPGTNGGVLVLPPTFTPNYGYHPMGVNVTVTSHVPVFYTLDGSEPTTNSLQVNLNNDIGTIRFMQHNRDLRSLRMKAIDGTNVSATVGGISAPANEIGIPRDISAGSFSTVVVPVVVNMKANSQIRSLQFRVRVTPLNGGPPVRPQLRATSMSSNDFVSVVTAAAPNTIASYLASGFSSTNAGVVTRELAVTALGTDANFLIDQYAVAAMVIIPMSRDAHAGHTYRVEVTNPSATSDAHQQIVPIVPMSARTITIVGVPYLVGDVSPGGWYNAGDFGDGRLGNDDVNAIFYASHGVYVPYASTDAFDAMDLHPIDGASVGGNAIINLGDLNVVLQRSFEYDPVNWLRFHMDGGDIGFQATTLPQPAPQPVPPPPAGPGTLWAPQATVGAVQQGYMIPGGKYKIPVYVKVAPGCSIAGMSIRASVVPNADAAAMGSIAFVEPLGGNFIGKNGLALNEVLCSWLFIPSPAFSPALTGSNIVGSIELTVPPTAVAGQSYTVKFLKLGGGADLNTLDDLEGIPMTFKVNTYATPTAEVISDEWKTYFFGTNIAVNAATLADPDEDGAPNWQEYLEGTSPVDPASRLRLEQEVVTDESGTSVQLSWLSASLKVYVVERAASASGPWATIASGIVGDGFVKQVYDAAPSAETLFYRVRVQP
ncbi:MAG TPA: chitobiase/beta-hexosaminidase C-terminal domain-containing protein, partial [Candidatus Acidoferrum sp.]|nr:chitobiase/beta-hexosaminidase C-terminal domain-containing protein [Candidatus Acidoferrum sp.]